jgi:galactose-1-phosphate uridylyltransferase
MRFEYWQHQDDYTISPDSAEWKKQYITTPGGKNHIQDLLYMKLERLGLREDEIREKIEKEFNNLTDPFFYGSHEMVVAAHHYRPGAEYEDELFYSGDLTPEEHYVYTKFTTESIKEILQNNKAATLIVMFQNWLKQAGASHLHLHRQLLAIDEWGPVLEKEAHFAAQDTNFFTNLIEGLGNEMDLVVAENKFGICLVEIGQRYPTAAVYSKCDNRRPFELFEEEIRGISDLILGCHKTLGRRSPSNEEWIYKPTDCDAPIPFQIRVRWRANPTAGFEGATDIYINPVNPYEFRDMLIEEFQDMRDKNDITNISIGNECPVAMDSAE